MKFWRRGKKTPAAPRGPASAAAPVGMGPGAAAFEPESPSVTGYAQGADFPPAAGYDFAPGGAPGAFSSTGQVQGALHGAESGLGGGPDVSGGEGWLSVDGIHKAFKRRKVVKGVSLALRTGEAVGLLGPNGAGKTTVFYMITGLIPADKGAITIDGHDVTKLPMYRRARLGIGYLPQEASIFRGLSVERNILAVLELTEKNRSARYDQLDALLREFRIEHLRKSPSIALSGGERRRCEIARALASRPSYMLLDEPFAGIDPLAIGDIQALVAQLKERGIGVLITDHNWRETLDLTDRAYIIYDGQVLTHGNPSEIINNKDVQRVYLGDQTGTAN